MAINTTNTVNSLAGDGTTTAIPITFVFFGSDELEVIERDAATGAETAKALTTHYTVSGGNGATGTVTALVAPAVGKSWFVRRKTKRLQSTVYSEGDPFPAKTHERALDRGLAISQEIEEKIGRALQFPKTETAAPPLPPIAQLLGKFFYMTAGGEIVGYDIATLGAIALPLGINQGGTGATDAAAARAALGLAALATKAKVALGDLDATGTPDGTRYLRGDWTWAVINSGGNYFGDGSDGALNTAGSVNLNSDTGVNDTGVVIKNYTNITINAGHTVTATTRAKALLLYATGNVVINGTLTMSSKGAAAAAAADVVVSKFIADALLPNEKALTAFRSVQVGGAAGTGGGANTVGGTGGTISNGTGGGGGGGGAGGSSTGGGAGAAGTAICGGSGGGGAAASASAVSGGAAAANGGVGGAGQNMVGNVGGGGGGGAGNAGGAGGTFNSAGTNGTAGGNGGGGLLIIVAAGTVTIGATGVVSSNGGNGGAGGNGGSNNGAGGGGAGGGRIIILSVGAYSNSGTVQANGGTGGAVGTGGSGGAAGGAGGAGAITQQRISA